MEPRVAPETEESLIVEHRRECMLRRAVRREFQQDLFALEGDASWEGPCRDGPSAASGTPPGVSSSVVVAWRRCGTPQEQQQLLLLLLRVVQEEVTSRCRTRAGGFPRRGR